MQEKQAYIDFIRYSLETTGNLPYSCKKIDWEDFLLYCNRQGIIGVVFEGIKKSGIRKLGNDLYEWISLSETIKSQNQLVNKRLIEVTQFFEDQGMRSCILKGQASGLMYPNPEDRSPGDIDIWVEGEREDIIRMVLAVTPHAHYSIHHIKLPVFSDVSVEVHYRPMYLSNWFKDKKLQRYISEIEERQFANRVHFVSEEIGCLTDDFNAVYQILHMYAHFFSSRNNFKQFIDYYYLLKKGLSEDEKHICADKLKEFGIEKFASGIMWIMEQVLGLEPELLVIPPNGKIGKIILRESEYFGTYPTNKLKYVLALYKANFRIVRSFSKEVLISPFFLVWHQWWKYKIKVALKTNDK